MLQGCTCVEAVKSKDKQRNAETVREQAAERQKHGAIGKSRGKQNIIE